MALPAYLFLVVCLLLFQLPHSHASQEVSSVPSAPNSVQMTPSYNIDDGAVITASWSMDDYCREQLNCLVPWGYIVTCCIPGEGIEIGTTVWESDIADQEPIRVNVTGVNPATQYVCKVASFNAYGIGNSGSNVFVSTLDAVPRTAPTQVYTSDVYTDSIRLNWYYSEVPSPGDINTFKIEVYYKDNRYPGRHGEHLYDILAPSQQSSVVFSYRMMYLDPGTEYNFLISAVTDAGEGPPARIGQKTASTVPVIIPHDVTGSILSYVHSEPPSFLFQWSVQNRDHHLLHDIAGFIISCSANKTTPIDDIITFSEPIFIEHAATSMQTYFSGVIYFPNTCDSGVSVDITCSVAAFNNEGPGEISNTVNITLPCQSVTPGALEGTFLTNPIISLGLLIAGLLTPGALEGTFLANPIISLGLVIAIILLILVMMVVIAMMCVCNSSSSKLKCGNHQQKILSTSSSIDNYIPMASTEAGIKPRWTGRHNAELSGPHSSPVGVVLIEHGDPAYEEIPADRFDNLYDEIHPHSCGGGARGRSQDSNLSSNGGTSITSKTHTPNETRRLARSRDGLQTIPLPSSSHSETIRDSTVSQYIEVTSPLLAGDVTNGNTMRYSVADSGVNMTSSDVERGLNLDPHSNLPRNQDAENIQFRRYPYFITDIPVPADRHDDDPDNESLNYGIITPFSLQKNNVELNVDMKLIDEEEVESGIGMESRASDSAINPRPHSKPGVGSIQKFVVERTTLVEPMYIKMKEKNSSRDTERSGANDGNKSEGEEEQEEEETTTAAREIREGGGGQCNDSERDDDDNGGDDQSEEEEEERDEEKEQ